MFYYHMRNLDKLINAGSPPKQKDEVKKEVKTLSEADQVKVDNLKTDSKPVEAKGFAFSGEAGAAPQITKWL